MNYETAQDLFDALCAPFAAEEIEWRVGSTTTDKSKGMAWAYIDARAVMDRLDGVCGPENWQCNYSPAPGNSIICNIGVRMPGGDWIWKADGAGATDVEGEKGMLSDALKRAAVRWGVGRYLYEMKSPWVELEEGRNGRAGPIKVSERKKLDETHDEASKRVGWGGPSDVATYRFLLRIVTETVTQPSDAEAFREKYKSMFPLLRVAARRHLDQTLSRVGSQREAAE
ncbi:Rad52/Rad22 family DNA repair protein [uncultured Bradyrhizobium sp.]|uniref:Rad52/Rad22 family DNA repair protein n=1 Tax=uncultured Bradyrhizobium sp. TaxID=199684 RepID=UPI0035CBA570